MFEFFWLKGTNDIGIHLPVQTANLLNGLIFGGYEDQRNVFRQAISSDCSQKRIAIDRGHAIVAKDN